MGVTHPTSEKPLGLLAKGSKNTPSHILKHCKDFHHALPSINDFSIIDKDPSQSLERPKKPFT